MLKVKNFCNLTAAVAVALAKSSSQLHTRTLAHTLANIVASALLLVVPFCELGQNLNISQHLTWRRAQKHKTRTTTTHTSCWHPNLHTHARVKAATALSSSLVLSLPLVLILNPSLLLCQFYTEFGDPLPLRTR